MEATQPTSSRCPTGPRKVTGCGGCPARKDDMVERVTCWRGCRVQGWRWGAGEPPPPRSDRASPRSPHLPRAALTWPAARHTVLPGSAVLIWAQTRCSGGWGKLRGRGRPAQLRPPVPARAGRARSQPRLEKERWLAPCHLWAGRRADSLPRPYLPSPGFLMKCQS